MGEVLSSGTAREAAGRGRQLRLRIVDLADMHPGLLWDDIMAAAVAVLDERGFSAPFALTMGVENVPAYGSGQVDLRIVKGGVPGSRIEKARRTFEAHRLIELAAIAVAGLVLFAAGGHVIRDVALRGSSADYLVDAENYLLEIAGRSRQGDLQPAWEARQSRLSERRASGFFVCVVEFETPSGLLTFAN